MKWRIKVKPDVIDPAHLPGSSFKFSCPLCDRMQFMSMEVPERKCMCGLSFKVELSIKIACDDGESYDPMNPG